MALRRRRLLRPLKEREARVSQASNDTTAAAQHGEYVSLAKVENAMKQCPYVEQARGQETVEGHLRCRLRPETLKP